MDEFDALIQAKSEMEFFILVSHLIRPDYFKVDREGSPIIRAELSQSEDKTHGLALEYEVEQSLIVPGMRGGTAYQGMTTHVFRLYQDGTLTWWMLGQPTLIGLKAIQAEFQRLRDSLKGKTLPSSV